MRTLCLTACLLLVAFAGCVDTGASEPSVSVNYSKSTQTQNGDTRTTISATLTGAEGLSDWSELAVTGCTAPSEGELVTPHKFASCSGALRIVHRATGDTLYASG